MTLATAPLVAVERPLLADLGFCMVCKRYRQYGEPCPVCKMPLEIRREVRNELEKELADLLLAVQDLFEQEPVVKGYMNPMWWQNATFGVDSPAQPKDDWNPAKPARPAGETTIRGAIRVLRGIAAQHGVLPLSAASAAAASEGRTVYIEFDGERWECWEDGKTKALRRVRLAPLPSDGAALSPKGGAL